MCHHTEWGLWIDYYGKYLARLSVSTCVFRFRLVKEGRLSRLLAVCLVTVLAQACFGPSQGPTSDGTTLYAPDQLAPALPAEVNGRQMIVGEYRSDEATTMFAQAPEAFQRYLLAIGKGPGDVVGATGQSDVQVLPDGRSSVVYIIALRVRGVSAEQVMSGLVSHTSPEPTLRPETVAGRQVFAVVRADPDPLYLYAYGEVLFIVGATPADLPSSDADAKAALAALP